MANRNGPGPAAADHMRRLCWFSMPATPHHAVTEILSWSDLSDRLRPDERRKSSGEQGHKVRYADASFAGLRVLIGLGLLANRQDVTGDVCVCIVSSF